LELDNTRRGCEFKDFCLFDPSIDDYPYSGFLEIEYEKAYYSR